MPKIRQAIAVFAAAAFCIGFNTFRYPVVWEMVAAAPQPSKPAESRPVATTSASPKDLDRTGSSGESADKTHSGPNCKDGVCTMVSPDPPVANIYGSVRNDTQTEPKSSTSPAFEPESKPKPFELESQSKPSEPESQSKGSEWEQKSKPLEPQSGSDETAPKPGAQDTGAEPTETDTSSYSFGSHGDKETEHKPPAKLVSKSATAKYPPEKAGNPPLGGEALVPIERPKSRAKAAAAPAGQPGSDSHADSTANRGPDFQKACHLPEVDPTSSPDSADPPPTVTPELMRSYRVTPAK